MGLFGPSTKEVEALIEKALANLEIRGVEMKPYFETNLGKLYCGNALDVLRQLPDESVDVVITSPPYWAKRDYGDATETVWPDGWRGQLGLEPTPQMFVEHLVEIFREVKRVLKPTGSLFVNIDDTWVGGGSWNNGGGRSYKDNEWERKAVVNATTPSPTTFYKGAKKKSLALVPELFAIKMVYDEGWILREKIIWAKKVHFYKERRAKGNAMPESVRDRFAHTWEYIFHFTKRPKYYFDWEVVAPEPSEINEEIVRKIREGDYKVRPNDVIQINVRPFKDAHFAVFPPDIPELLIKAACPKDGVVLDPFAGAGTTLVVAEKMGRRWIGIEMNPDYCEIIKRRFERELGGVIKVKRLDEFLGG